METFLPYLFFILGVAIIIKGSGWFIDAAVWFASSFGIPQIIIGATVVSFCTTLPETLAGCTAALSGATDMTVGNSLGSVATNTGLIMAVLFMFGSPQIEDKKAFAKNGCLLLFVLSFCWAVGWFIGQLNIFSGLFLLLVMLFFLLSNARSAQKSLRKLAPSSESGSLTDSSAKAESSESHSLAKQIVLFLLGVLLVIAGAQLIVSNGIRIAEMLGVPTFLIAVVFTSLGTSLPELVTILSAIRKNAAALGLGNLVGANIFNIVQVLGIAALISPIDLAADRSLLLFQFPMAFLLAALSVLFGFFLEGAGHEADNPGFFKAHRSTLLGFLLFLPYLVFLFANILRENTPLLGSLF